VLAIVAGFTGVTRIVAITSGFWEARDGFWLRTRLSDRYKKGNKNKKQLVHGDGLAVKAKMIDSAARAKM
jgi:hypothetical protein